MIYSFILALQMLVHPFHVSVTEVKYKEEKKAIQISTRIFLDDLEETLQAYLRDEKLNITAEENWGVVNTTLKTYVLEKLKLSNEKGALELLYVGAEIEKDVMWVYVEVLKVKKLKRIKVWNGLLTDKFDDQENIVHFRAFDKVKSARLYKGDEEKVFDWEIH